MQNIFIAVKDKDWEGEFDPMDACVGEECDEDVEDRPPCDECADEDAVCMENCWSVEPSESKPPKGKNKPRPQGRHKPRMTGGNRQIGGRNNQRRGGRIRMPHRKPKKMMRKMNKNMLWKPKGRKMHRLMGKKHMGLMKPGMMNMGPMKRQGMRPMGPPRYGGNPMISPMIGHQSRMGPMIHGRKPMMPGMMHPDKFMGPMMHDRKPMMHGMMHPDKFMGPMMHGRKPMMHGMKYGMGKMHMNHMMSNKMMGMSQGRPMMGQDTMMDKTMGGHGMMHHHMETGPVIRSHRSLRGEFYTKVIFARDGTCNAIIHDLSCFGEQKNIRMRAGRVGQTPISVPMCPRPTILKNTTAQFTCNSGASFLKPVLLPVRCSYVPCNPGFWLPDWSKDDYWDGDNSYPGDYWGNKRDDWLFANRNQNRVEKTKSWQTGGL